MLPVGCVTLFRARRLYARDRHGLSPGDPRALRHPDARARRSPFPRTQTVYISNHTSTLDLFVLVALGLPNCRFFLSGFLRKFVPLGDHQLR